LKRNQRASKSDFLAQAQPRCFDERLSEMKWRWQRSGFQRRYAAARLDEVELAMPRDFVIDAKTPVEVHQVDAAAQQDVLAIVDRFAGGFIRRGASAKGRPRLVKIDFPTGFAERRSARQSRQSAPGDDHRGHECSLVRGYECAIPFAAAAIVQQYIRNRKHNCVEEDVQEEHAFSMGAMEVLEQQAEVPVLRKLF